MFDVRRGCHLVCEIGKIRRTADAREEFVFLQVVRDRHHVDRLPFFVEREHAFVDAFIGGGVEIGGHQKIRDAEDGVFIDEQAAENRRLGVEVLRWDLQL